MSMPWEAGVICQPCIRPRNKLERFSVAKRYLVLISRICIILAAVIVLGVLGNVCAYVYLRPALPDVESLRDVQLQVPLRVYTRDGRLIAAIGEQRRIPVRYDQLPPKLIQAFLATEDDRFFRHHGVDWQGILRAAVANLRAGGIRQGASTITMQVSRDMFLTPRRDMKRKMSEIYISLLMEAEFTKEEIFSLYVNKIFLGQRAYGVGAAAEVYFGKSLDQLSLAEMVRNDMQNKYGDAVYTAGYKVYTTLDSRLQAAGTVALRTGLIEYDMRHGYRGASAKVDLSKIVTTAQFDAQLEEFPIIGGLKPAIVEQVEAKSAKIYVKGLGVVTLPWEKLAWARRELPDEKVDRAPTQASEILSRGDVIYTVGRTPESLLFVQIPEAQGALVSVDPKDGAVVALVGGFDFFQSKYNRVVQARRQPGSGFKPFIYAAAFDKGFTPASVVLDAPVVIDEEGKEQEWRPKEFESRFAGPVRLRDALVHSRNLVSVRLMRAIGGQYARDYVTRFGFDKSQLPDDLTLALGTAELSPLQVAIGYSAFANGGFKVSSYYIDRIEDANGKILQQANPAVACPQCGVPSDGPGPKSVAAGGRAALLDQAPHDGKTLIPEKNLAPQSLRPQVAYLLADMMADVIKRGTGQRARTLNRDVA